MFARPSWAAPLLLCLALGAIVYATLDDYGLTWDEPVYVVAGRSYASWFSRPTLARIRPCWSVTSESPPLGKLAGAFSGWLFSDQFKVMPRFKAFRLQALLFGFVLNFALFVWVREYWGGATALAAVLSFFFLPRAFFHAHLGDLDFPMTAMWVVTAWAFWKGLKSPRWMLAASVLLGLSLLTKVNAAFLWMLLLVWFAVWFRSDLRRLLAERGRGALKERVVRDLAALLIVPPLVFFIGWPLLWVDPGHVGRYWEWQMAHEQFPVYYLGRTWIRAPWHYAFVVTAVTVPLAVLVPLLAGLFRLRRMPHRAAAAFLLANALVPILAIALVSRCVYDGERLFLPAFPFLCALAALGVRELYLMAARIKAEKIFAALYALLFTASVFFSIVRYHPYESSYFNELVGGVDGAAARGFETEYWGHPLRAVLPWLNAHPESTVWVPIDRNGLQVYQPPGPLTRPVRFVDGPDADYLILLIRQGSFSLDPRLWEIYTREKPVFSVKVFDTLLVGIYRL